VQNTVTVLVGRKGTGKSTLVSEIIAERPCVWVIDSMGEYDEKRGKCEVIFWDEDESSPDRVLASSRKREFRLSIRALGTDDNLDAMRLCYALAEERRNSLLVVEETSLYVSPVSLPDEIAALVRYGRHRELDLVFVARRPAELHRDLTANADCLVTFQTQEPRDLDYLRVYYGDEAYSLARLPPYHIKVFGDLNKAPDAVLERLHKQGS
jgi:DNA helicase HerA-like ATPase